MLNSISSKLDLSHLRYWGMKGGIAILDQAIFSASTFVVDILLARWLTLADFGGFSVAFSIYLIFLGLYNALLLEPMSIFGPANYPNRIHDYFILQLRLHILITVPLGILTGISGWLLFVTEVGDIWLTKSLIGVGIAIPFLLLIWMVRRMSYILKQPSRALLASAIYACLLITGVVVFKHWGLISAQLTLELMGLAGLGAGLIILWQENIKIYKKLDLSVKDVYSHQWDFSKWLVGAYILSAFASQTLTFLSAGLINLEAAGVLNALQNFAQPMTQVVSAISTLGLPILAADFGKGNFIQLRQKGLLLISPLTGLVILYEILISLFKRPLEQFVYGGKYAADAWLIIPLGMVPVFTALYTGFSLFVRAIQKPRYYFISGGITAFVGTICSLILIKIGGIGGAAWGLVLTYVISFVMAYYFYKRWFPKAIQ